MLSSLPYQDSLTILFCLVDDLLALLPRTALRLPPPAHPGGHPPSLSIAETLTLALFRFWTTQRTWKAFHALLMAAFRREFPSLPCYETLLRQINRHGALGLVLLVALFGQQDPTGGFFLDATALPVSRQGRRAKAVRALAAWGKDSQGQWFFGFKLHAVCDERGLLVRLCLTPGNAADVAQAEALLQGLRGLVVADAAYVSGALRERLWEAGVLLLTPLRKSMKGLASAEQLQHFKDRHLIETVFSVLKDRLGLVTSLPRSVDGYLSHYIFTLLAYQLGRLTQQALASPTLPRP